MSSRKLAASIDDKKEAGETLKSIFFDGKDDETTGIWLHDHLQKRSPGIEKILAADDGTGSSELPDEELPRTLVDMFGSEVFEGANGAELRDKILNKLFEKGEYKKIFKIFLGSSSTSNAGIENMKIKFNKDPKGEAKEYLQSMKEDRRRHPWKPGKVYAIRFVEQLRLADIFAGISSDPKPGRIEEAVPKTDLKKLINFQENMKRQIIEILEGSNENRAIVTLPTGAGKTRIVVEAIVEFLNKNGVDKNILWIAQSQEVCEQAVLCFKQIWEHNGRGETLNIFRAWGTNDIPTADEHGIIVGGVQKLVSRYNELHNLTDDDTLSAVFIDEAHHSIADSYLKILAGLNISSFPGGYDHYDKVPLIGLTATPERRLDFETEQLQKMYGEKRIYPSEKFQPDSDIEGNRFGEQWKDLRFMRKKLQDFKYLDIALDWDTFVPKYRIFFPSRASFKISFFMFLFRSASVAILSIHSSPPLLKSSVSFSLNFRIFFPGSIPMYSACARYLKSCSFFLIKRRSFHCSPKRFPSMSESGWNFSLG